MRESNFELFKTLCSQPNLRDGQWWRVESCPFPVLSGTVIARPPGSDGEPIVIATLDPPRDGEPIPLERALEIVLLLDAQAANDANDSER